MQNYLTGENSNTAYLIPVNKYNQSTSYRLKWFPQQIDALAASQISSHINL